MKIQLGILEFPKNSSSVFYRLAQFFFASHPLVASHPLGERFLVLKPQRKSAVAVAFAKVLRQLFKRRTGKQEKAFAYGAGLRKALRLKSA
ncbi:MAG: hypothetical protein SPH02_07470 [Campylobacter sp.]|nr:hypothetical protein [Campylobacter sp.]